MAGSSLDTAELSESGQKSDGSELVTKQLDNGLTVIIKKDSSIPKVAVTVMTKGGIRRETIQTNGLSQLSAMAFEKECPIFKDSV